MPEGLFIFCLLIRAASGGGGAEVGEGPKSNTLKRMKVMTKREHLVPEKVLTFASLLYHRRPTVPSAGILLKIFEAEDE